MNNYILFYALDSINLYRQFNLDGKCLMQASSAEWAATNLSTYFRKLNIDAHILDVQEIESYESVIQRISENKE